MKERPIVFSGPMIRALLSGQKTQTRRLARDAPGWADHAFETVGGEWGFGDNEERGEYRRCPYGVPGDRLWVRETMKATPGPPRSGEWRISYVADGVGVDLRRERPAAGDKRLRYGISRQTIPSIHMPRWASRITLEVTEVRVQRLQDISEEDAIAEGVDAVSMADAPRQATWNRRQDFAQLWQSINAKRAPWDSNPWVWAVTFRRCA